MDALADCIAPAHTIARQILARTRDNAWMDSAYAPMAGRDPLASSVVAKYECTILWAPYTMDGATIL